MEYPNDIIQAFTLLSVYALDSKLHSRYEITKTYLAKFLGVDRSVISEIDNFIRSDTELHLINQLTKAMSGFDILNCQSLRDLRSNANDLVIYLSDSMQEEIYQNHKQLFYSLLYDLSKMPYTYTYKACKYKYQDFIKEFKPQLDTLSHRIAEITNESTNENKLAKMMLDDFADHHDYAMLIERTLTGNIQYAVQSLDEFYIITVKENCINQYDWCHQ